METTNKMIRVFAGSGISVNLLSAELEQAGIASSIINEYEQSNFRGFSTGTPYSVDLYILDSDLEKAQPFIDEFMRMNQM